MKKELMILPKNLIKNTWWFNVRNKITKKFYICELDSIGDFEENINQVTSAQSKVFGYLFMIYNYLSNVMVKEIKDVSKENKLLSVFDFSGDLSLNTSMLEKKLWRHPRLSQVGKEINQVKTLDTVDIVFTYEYHLQDEKYFLMLQSIWKSEDNGKSKQSQIIKPVFDLVYN